MEKLDELKAFAEMCSKSLSDDVELRQKAKAELLDHLEDAFEEERQDATEEEALGNTFKRGELIICFKKGSHIPKA